MLSLHIFSLVNIIIYYTMFICAVKINILHSHSQGHSHWKYYFKMLLSWICFVEYISLKTLSTLDQCLHIQTYWLCCGLVRMILLLWFFIAKKTHTLGWRVYTINSMCPTWRHRYHAMFWDITIMAPNTIAIWQTLEHLSKPAKCR